jgi:hypothetical protein
MIVFDLAAAHCSKYLRIGPCFENRRNIKKSLSTTRSHLDIARDADDRSGSKAEVDADELIVCTAPSSGNSQRDHSTKTHHLRCFPCHYVLHERAALKVIFGNDMKYLQQARRRLELLSNKAVQAARGDGQIPRPGVINALKKPLDSVLRLVWRALEGAAAAENSMFWPNGFPILPKRPTIS